MNPCVRRLRVATQTTTTTAQSFLLATGLGGGDKISATFSTFRTATTVATSVAASDLYRSDSSSMAPSVSESSYWDNESSAGSQHHPYGKLPSDMRDRCKEGIWLRSRRRDIYQGAAVLRPAGGY